MLSDQEILALIEEEKILPENFRQTLEIKNKSDLAHKECDIMAKSRSGKDFVVTIRVNIHDKFDFSIILMYVDDRKIRYILKRYNGRHQHKNIIERNKILGFHIHTGTERYQRLLKRIDGFAEITDAYNNWDGAFAQMIIDCNFRAENTFIITPLASFLASN